MRTQQTTTTHQHQYRIDAEAHSPNRIHRIAFTELKFEYLSHRISFIERSPNHIHRTKVQMSHAGCRGYIGRQEHPETQSNTRTYGTKRSSYVHAYIGKDGKRRRRVQRRKSEKRKPPRARREKILNYRKWPRRPCRNSMNCVTCRYVIRTSPGGADAHMRTHDGEIKVPTLVPSHRRVKHG